MLQDQDKVEIIAFAAEDSRYDPSKDQDLGEAGSVPVEHSGGKISVHLRSYDEGPTVVDLIGEVEYCPPDLPLMTIDQAKQLGAILVGLTETTLVRHRLQSVPRSAETPSEESKQ